MTPAFFPRNSFGSRVRFIATGVAIAMSAAFFVPTNVGAQAENPSVKVGTFSLGGATGGIDERTGKLQAGLTIATLPGVKAGGVTLGLSYSQDIANENRDDFGNGWAWSHPFVNTSAPGGGVKLFSGSKLFDVDATGQGKASGNDDASGLADYTLKNLKFRTKQGTLPARPGVSSEVSYSYVLQQEGAATSYFDTDGNLVATQDPNHNRVDYSWGENHSLKAVVDDGGNTLNIEKTDSGLKISEAANAKGVRATVLIAITDGYISRVLDPMKRATTFNYYKGGDYKGLLQSVLSPLGSKTSVTYQKLPAPDSSVAVEDVTVTDAKSQAVLSTRKWGIIGDNTSSGKRAGFNGESDLWQSGSDYTYKTVLKDEASQFVSTYNSRGLLVDRKTDVSPESGSDITVKQENYTYQYNPGDKSGKIPAGDAVQPQYASPVQTQMTYRDAGTNTRETTQTAQYDQYGRVISQKGIDDVVTTTKYDDTTPAGRDVPIGLTLSQKTQGVDGTVSETDNALTPDHTAIAKTTNLSGTTKAPLTPTKTTEYTVDPDGFVSEQRVTAAGDSGKEPKAVATKYARSIDDKNVTLVETTVDSDGKTPLITTKKVEDKGTGYLMSTVDAAGNTASSTYDLLGRMVSKTDGADRTTTVVYDGNVTRTTRPDHVTVSTHLDALGRTVLTKDNIKDGVPNPGHNDRVIEKVSYENNGSKVTTTDANNISSTNETDVFGRTVKTSGPNTTTLNQYNDVANTSTTGVVAGDEGIDKSLSATTTINDKAGRVTKQTTTRSDKASVPDVAMSYDDLGRETQKTAGDLSTKTEFNADGTPKVVTETPQSTDFAAAPKTATRDFAGLFGKSTKSTLSQSGSDSRDGGSRRFDAAGRVIEQDDQLGNATTSKYSADGLPLVIENVKAKTVTTNTYDPKTRILVKSETKSPNGTVGREITFDKLSGKTLSVFDPAKRKDTEIFYTYDALGHLTSVTYPDGKKITHTYDPSGRNISTTDTAGNTTTYSYRQSDGALSDVTQKSASGATLARVTYAYDKYGRLSELTRANGLKTDYTYTSDNSIATEKTVTGAPNIFASETPVFSGSYNYDSHGNISQATITQPAETDASKPVTETTHYSYDAFNRLTQSTLFDGATTAGAPKETNSYVFNVSGDVTKQTTLKDNTTTVRDFSYDKLGRLSTVATNNAQPGSESYDDEGSMTASTDKTQYTYNALSQQVSEKRADGTSVDTSFWADGSRKTTTTANGTSSDAVTTYWDGKILSNELFASSASAAPTAVSSYLLGSVRFARTVMPSDGATPQTDYYVADRHGSTRATVSVPGAVTNTYRYSDYGIARHSGGQATGANRNPFQYAGEYTLEDGTLALQKREYDPSLMRFTTKDSAALHNLYAYGNGDPIKMVDPSGKSSVPDEDYWNLVKGGIMLGLELAIGIAVMGFETFSYGMFVASGWGRAATALSWLNIGIGGVRGVNDLMVGNGGQSMYSSGFDTVLQAADYGTMFFAVIAGGLAAVDNGKRIARLGELGLSDTAGAEYKEVRTVYKEKFFQKPHEADFRETFMPSFFGGSEDAKVVDYLDRNIAAPARYMWGKVSTGDFGGLASDAADYFFFDARPVKWAGRQLERAANLFLPESSFAMRPHWESAIDNAGLAHRVPSNQKLWDEAVAQVQSSKLAADGASEGTGLLARAAKNGVSVSSGTAGLNRVAGMGAGIVVAKVGLAITDSQY